MRATITIFPPCSFLCVRNRQLSLAPPLGSSWHRWATGRAKCRLRLRLRLCLVVRPWGQTGSPTNVRKTQKGGSSCTPPRGGQFDLRTFSLYPRRAVRPAMHDIPVPRLALPGPISSALPSPGRSDVLARPRQGFQMLWCIGL